MAQFRLPCSGIHNRLLPWELTLLEVQSCRLNSILGLLWHTPRCVQCVLYPSHLQQGSIDATTYPISGNISTLHVQAEASANVLAWAYAAIGEFCDVNGKEGAISDSCLVHLSFLRLSEGYH